LIHHTEGEAQPTLRLRKDEQIRCVLDHGLLFRGKHLLARLIPSEKVSPLLNEKGPFLAVVISRKKSKRAVARNRMRRQLREAFRKKYGILPEQTACVLIARHVDKKISYQELEQDLLEIIFNYREKSESKPAI